MLRWGGTDRRRGPCNRSASEGAEPEGAALAAAHAEGDEGLASAPAGELLERREDEASPGHPYGMARHLALRRGQPLCVDLREQLVADLARGIPSPIDQLNGLGKV